MEASICTVNPRRHYLEFDKGQYDRQTVHAIAREMFDGVMIDKITPTSPSLWLVETITPYPKEN